MLVILRFFDSHYFFLVIVHVITGVAIAEIHVHVCHKYMLDTPSYYECAVPLCRQRERLRIGQNCRVVRP